jgi:PAS domain S-box-containing protein
MNTKGLFSFEGERWSAAKRVSPAKWLLMAGLVLVAGLITIYFHRFLGTETVFTHFFYIPIILGALWWGRNGIGVALILVAILLVSHWVFRPDYVHLNDYFRAILFLVVAWVVVLLRGRILATEAALQKKTKELESRVRSLSCLYSINKLRENRQIPLADIFLETVKLLEKAVDVEPVAVRISYQGSFFDIKESLQNPVRLAQPIAAEGQPVGTIEMRWPDNYPIPDDLLDMARQLIDTVAWRLGKIVEHEKARSDLDRHRLQLEELVRERTEELIAVNRRLREEINVREKAEIALRDSEKQYRILIENAAEAIYIAQEGHIRFANPALATLGGYPIDYLLKTPFLDLIHPDDRKMVADRYKQRLAGETVPHIYAFRIQTADETYRWVELDTVVIQWHERPATLNFLRDITDRKRVEASIGQIRKMEAIGLLAGGIAHQFNNALSGIFGNIDVLKLSVPENPHVQRCGDTMLQCAQTMAGLTQQLLAYARGGKYQSEPHSLNLLVKEVLHQVASTGDKRIQIDTALSPDTPMVEVDTVQIRMVMLAVINNAAEAIEKNGRIRIETFRARIDAAAAEAFPALPPGEYAGLSIIDDGRGMTEEVREHIFEPFFTTKFLGRGMGMAAAYGIIKNHGGYIYVDSEPDRGTVVHILLPPCGAF